MFYAAPKILDHDRYWHHVDQDNIRVRRHPEFDLYIHNYTEKVQFGRVWDDVTRTCRGLITDAFGDTVARPFAKFFNYGESDAPTLRPADLVRVTDKVDGSLGILYRLPDGGHAVATRGSFESEQAKWATAHYNEYYAGQWLVDSAFTYLFEIVYPENRIVLDYRDTEALVLLGAVDNDNGVLLAGTTVAAIDGWPGPVVQDLGVMSLAKAISLPPRKNAEGVVLQGDNVMVKVKQEDYVALHKVVTGLTEKVVWEHLRDDTYGRLIEIVPDEWLAWVKDVSYRLQREHDRMVIGALKDFNRIHHIEDRRAFAEAAKTSEFQHLLYDLRDDNQARMHKRIWKQIEPMGPSPATAADRLAA